VLDAAVDPRPLDGVEREGDLLERVLGGVLIGGGVRHELLDGRDPSLADLHRVELLGRAVAQGFGRKKRNFPSIIWLVTSALAMSGVDLSIRLTIFNGR